MCSVKHLRLAPVLAIGFALFAGTPALAQEKPYYPSFDGTCRLEAVGDEPCASGTATLDVYPYVFSFSLTCNGLTPGETYLVEFPGCPPEFNSWGIANRRGTLTLGNWCTNDYLLGPGNVVVYRTGGTDTEPEPVLSGPVSWKRRQH